MMRKERRGPRRSLPGSGVVSTISTDLLRCIFGPLERRDRPERDDDATKGCFLIEFVIMPSFKKGRCSNEREF